VASRSVITTFYLISLATNVAIVPLDRARLDRIKDLKKRLEDAKHQLEVSQRQGQFEIASRLRFSTIPELERQLPVEGEPTRDDVESPLAMLHDRVTSNDIARVVAKSTGIPVQNLLKGERDRLVHVCGLLFPLRQRVDIDWIIRRWKIRFDREWSDRITY
jgi:ATP-dependent Clp protease ATP-binding subunit ClpA